MLTVERKVVLQERTDSEGKIYYISLALTLKFFFGPSLQVLQLSNLFLSYVATDNISAIRHPLLSGITLLQLLNLRFSDLIDGGEAGTDGHREVSRQ